MSKSDLITPNKKAWNKVYTGIPRLHYPDLMFIHFLMSYARKRQDNIKKALVIGSGDGVEAFALARLGIEVSCVDISENSIERVTQFSKDDGLEDLVNARVGDQRDLSAFETGSFDLAVSWSVISYGSEADGQKAISELHRVLKKGGGLIALLESTEHTGYTQPGAVKIGPRTYQMPESPEQSKGGVILTYYDEPQARAALSAFPELCLSHRVIDLPPDLKRKVGQWLFYAKK